MILPGIVLHAGSRACLPSPFSRWSEALGALEAELGAHPHLGPDRLPDFLEGVAAEHADEVLEDLIALHLQRSWKAGRGRPLEVYVETLGPRTAQLASLPDLPELLIEDEFLARHALPGGDLPGLAPYERRFPARPEVLARLRGRCLGEGRYVRLERLGGGGMGEVWLACDRERARPVAIKRARGEERDGPYPARLIEEARLLAKLDHPGIAACQELGRDAGGCPYLVLRLAPGRSLAEVIHDFHRPLRRRGRAATKELRDRLLAAVAAICDAVAHAHARGVLHLDLKPANVLVGDAGEPVVIDWGTAANVACARSTPVDGARTPTSRPVCGTPECMAPEQAEGRFDERSDVFGIGAILYELLTGRLPRAWTEGVRPAVWQTALRKLEIVRPRDRDPRLPRDLERICRTALAAEPDERYASVADLAQALRVHLGETRSGRLDGCALPRWLERLLAPRGTVDRRAI